MKGFKRGRHFAKTNRNHSKIRFLSLVALVEILAIMVISTSAWIESISSIRIYTKGSAKGTVETAKLQQVDLKNNSSTTINLTEYFRPSGGYHLAPASSADGDTMYFKARMDSGTQTYRLGSVNDKNVNYISFTVKTKNTAAVSLAFDQVPTISFGGTALSGNDRKLVRLAVGDTNGNFTIYSLFDQEFDEDVINGENGTTLANTTVHPFSDFVKGKNRVVETTANGFLSFNLWIQDPTGARSSVYQNKELTVSNFKLVTVTPFTVKSVTNNAVGGAGGNVAIENSAYGATAVFYATVGQSINLHAAPSTTNGYDFTGWASSPTGAIFSGSDVDPYAYTVSTANETLYAKFSNTHDLYMKPEYTHDANVRYAAYVFGIDNNGQNTATWYSMDAVSSGTWSGFYKCSYSGSATNVIFCYMDPNNATNDFANRWLQTFDLRVPSKNGEYAYIVTSRAVVGTARNQAISNYGTNKLFGYWKHSHARVTVANYASYSGAGSISVAIKDSSCVSGTATWYPQNSSHVDLDGQAYQDKDGNGNLIANQKYDKKVTLTAEDSATMDFKGWFESTTATTALSTSKSFEVTAPDNPDYTPGGQDQVENVTYYAKYEPKPVQYYVKGVFNSWGTADLMSVSGNTYTVSIDIPEGQDQEFKICKVEGSTETWYGRNNASYNETCSNQTLDTNSGNIKFTAHAGNYTFTFNSSNNQLTITRNQYNNITITLDSSSTTWIADNEAIVWCEIGGTGYSMTKNSSSNWTCSVPSNKTGNVEFKRNNKENNTTWNTWNAGSRNYSTTYKTSGNGTGAWQ